LLADEQGEIAKAFGAAYLGGLLPLTKRVTFVIDGEGVIRGVFHHELAIGRHVDEVRRCLESLSRHAAQSTVE
jgi:peroxiredoxin Q/BCP